MLLTYAHEYGERELPDNATRIPFRLTQSDLARLIGSSRASVNKAMGMLVAEGLVRVERYQCIVTNSTALERYCL
jgi:CRP-like cAMP-binding protein